jgi:hypothetical protein
MARGSILVNGHTLGQSGGAAESEEDQVVNTRQEKAEVLLYDLA